MNGWDFVTQLIKGTLTEEEKKEEFNKQEKELKHELITLIKSMQMYIWETNPPAEDNKMKKIYDLWKKSYQKSGKTTKRDAVIELYKKNERLQAESERLIKERKRVYDTNFVEIDALIALREQDVAGASYLELLEKEDEELMQTPEVSVELLQMILENVAKDFKRLSSENGVLWTTFKEGRGFVDDLVDTDDRNDNDKISIVFDNNALNDTFGEKKPKEMNSIEMDNIDFGEFSIFPEEALESGNTTETKKQKPILIHRKNAVLVPSKNKICKDRYENEDEDEDRYKEDNCRNVEDNSKKIQSYFKLKKKNNKIPSEFMLAKKKNNANKEDESKISEKETEQEENIFEDKIKRKENKDTISELVHQEFAEYEEPSENNFFPENSRIDFRNFDNFLDESMVVKNKITEQQKIKDFMKKNKEKDLNKNVYVNNTSNENVDRYKIDMQNKTNLVKSDENINTGMNLPEDDEIVNIFSSQLENEEKDIQDMQNRMNFFDEDEESDNIILSKLKSKKKSSSTNIETSNCSAEENNNINDSFDLSGAYENGILGNLKIYHKNILKELEESITNLKDTNNTSQLEKQ